MFQEVFFTFLAHFSMSKKTQDFLRGFLVNFQHIFQFFLEIFNKFLNFNQDPGCFRRFCVNFQPIFQFCKEDPIFLRRISTIIFILTLQPDLHSLCFISNTVNDGLVTHFSRFYSRCLALLSRCLFSSKNSLVLLLFF